MVSDLMNYWLEVTIGVRWQRMLEEGQIRLDAPNKTRYINFFNGMEAGDIILHYLTSALTPSRLREKKSSVFAVSKIASNPQVVGNKIVAKCSGTYLFKKPVPRSELMNLPKKSSELEKLLRVSMMRYLTKISDSDFVSIVKKLPENKRIVTKFAQF